MSNNYEFFFCNSGQQPVIKINGIATFVYFPSTVEKFQKFFRTSNIRIPFSKEVRVKSECSGKEFLVIQRYSFEFRIGISVF